MEGLGAVLVWWFDTAQWSGAEATDKKDHPGTEASAPSWEQNGLPVLSQEVDGRGAESEGESNKPSS